LRRIFSSLTFYYFHFSFEVENNDVVTMRRRNSWAVNLLVLRLCCVPLPFNALDLLSYTLSLALSLSRKTHTHTHSQRLRIQCLNALLRLAGERMAKRERRGLNTHNSNTHLLSISLSSKNVALLVCVWVCVCV